MNRDINKIEKKKVDMRAAVQVLKKLENFAKDDNNIVSLRRFVTVNLDVLSRLVQFSGKNLRNIYEDLKASGLDVGTYHGFRSTCYRAGLRRRQKRRLPVLQEPAGSVKNPQKIQEPKGKGDVTATSAERRPGVSRYNPALSPIILPGGIEAIIDPETGAKRFEI